MTTTDRDFNLDERHGDAVRRAYAGVALTAEQRRRHRMRLAGAARRGSDRFRFHAAEIGVIAAVALFAILTVVVWQSLDSGDGDEAGVGEISTATEEEAVSTMVPQPTPSDAAEGTPGGTPPGSDDEQSADQSVATIVRTPPNAPEETPGGTPQPEGVLQPDDPEFDAIRAAREAAMPYPPPDTCPASEWAGPENRLHYQYMVGAGQQGAWRLSYFLDGSGVSLTTDLGLLFEGKNFVYWITARTYYPQDTVYRAERLDGESEPAAISFEDRLSVVGVDDDASLIVRPATITFPSPGCWLITVESQDMGFRHTVYVYPEDERPDAAASVQEHERLYTGDASGQINGIDVETGVRFLTVDARTDADIALSPDGMTLYVVDDESLAALDAVTGEQRWRVPTDYRRVTYMGGSLPVIAISGDGSLVYVYGTNPPGSLDYVITAHDTTTGQPVSSVPVPIYVGEMAGSQVVTNFCAPSIWPSISGSQLLAFCESGGNASRSSDIHLFDMEPGEPIQTDRMPIDFGWIVTSTGSADGTRIYAVSNQGYLAIYDRDSLEMIDSLELLDDATPAYRGLAISPDGSRLYVAISTAESQAYFREIRVFDTATWDEVDRIELDFDAFSRGLAVDSAGNLYGVERLSAEGSRSQVWKRDATTGEVNILFVADAEMQQLIVAGSGE